MAGLKKALLFINLRRNKAREKGEEIRAGLEKRGMAVTAFTFEDSLVFRREDGYDVAFSLGGDGTVLYAARAMAPLGVPIIPVNLGTLGFIAAVQPEKWEAVFERWLEGQVPLSRRFMLEVAVERGGKRLALGSCLNDAVISALGIAKIIRLRVESILPPSPESGGRTEYVQMGSYHSDGLIVATPTGSTAYSVASGGPILEPEMDAIIINPICPFTLSNRPIVLPSRETVIVEVQENQRSGVLLTVDGQVTEPLEPGDRIYLKQAPFKAQLVASGRLAFYNALRSKLAWSGAAGEGGGHA